MSKMKAPFKPEMFKGDQFSTAEQDAKFANWLVGFVKDGCPAEKFPKWAYKRLNLTFGFMAHFNHEGFSATYFQNAHQKVSFIEQMLACYWASSDYERAIVYWLVENDILAIYREGAARATEQRERSLLAILQAKYPGQAPADLSDPQTMMWQRKLGIAATQGAFA